MKILAIVEDLRINATSAGICNSNVLNSLLLHDHQIDCLYDYAHSDVFPWLSNPKIRFTKIQNIEFNLLQKIVKKIPKTDAISSHLTGFSLDQNQKIASWEKSIQVKIDANYYDFILILGAGSSMLNYFAMNTIKTTIPYIVNYHDPYPLSQYPEPYKVIHTRVSKHNIKKSNFVIEKAFKVSFPSLRLYEWMLQFHPNLKGKQIILPHPNGELQNLTVNKDDLDVNFNSNKFNITHAGSLLGHRNPSFLINAFVKFLDSDIEKKELSILNIVGTIGKSNSFFKEDMISYSNNINIIDKRISYQKSLCLLKESNVLLIIEAAAEESPFMPGKLTDYIIANKPIMALTPQKSEVSRLLGQDYPYKTEVDNEAEILVILNLLWDNWKKEIAQDLGRVDLKEYVSASYCNEQLMHNF